MDEMFEYCSLSYIGIKKYPVPGKQCIVEFYIDKSECLVVSYRNFLQCWFTVWLTPVLRKSVKTIP